MICTLCGIYSLKHAAIEIIPDGKTDLVFFMVHRENSVLNNPVQFRRNSRLSMDYVAHADKSLLKIGDPGIAKSHIEGSLGEGQAISAGSLCIHQVKLRAKLLNIRA